MKTAQDPRHLNRIKIMQDLFAWNFSDQQPLSTTEAQEIIENIKSIDQTIQEAAPTWPIEKINKVDLAILRLSVYELTIKKDVPVRVVDEAVELGKEYGSKSSSSFINGALGKLISDLKL